MSAREEAEAFLRKAEEDMRAIRAMVSAEDFSDAILWTGTTSYIKWKHWTSV